MLLTPSMVTSGKDALRRADPDEVADKTLTCLMRTAPAGVPGIVFLSGGHTDQEATANLNEINKKAAAVSVPWQLNFSYGRAPQGSPLKAWAGNRKNVLSAWEAFYERARLAGLDRQGSLQRELAIIDEKVFQ